MDSLTQTFRAKLFAGVATLLPLYLTYVVIRFLFESLEEMSGPILEQFGLGIPGLGIILTNHHSDLFIGNYRYQLFGQKNF